MSEFFDSLETRNPDQRAQAQFLALRQQVVHAQANCDAYQNRLADFEAEAVIDAASFARLPVTRKSELMELQRAHPPLGGFAASQPSHIYASPGPIYEPGFDTSDYWRLARALFAAGFRAGELVHNCFSYHMVPAGKMLEAGAQALGCSVIPAGTGQTEQQVATIADLKPDAYVGTPSYLKIILEKAEQQGINIASISKALVSGEALPPSIRDYFDQCGISTQQCYATADLGLIAYESLAREGLIIDEGIYLEIVRPGSGDPVNDGEVGEVVVTQLGPEYPLIRFATGDLSAIMPGESPCGRSNRRIKGWMGRADQTAKVRGMFIHPQQIDAICKRHPEIIRARLVVEWVDQADQIKLRCETAGGSDHDALSSAITDSIRALCQLRGSVELLAIDSLPNDGKVIHDIRNYD